MEYLSLLWNTRRDAVTSMDEALRGLKLNDDDAGEVKVWWLGFERNYREERFAKGISLAGAQRGHGVIVGRFAIGVSR